MTTRELACADVVAASRPSNPAAAGDSGCPAAPVGAHLFSARTRTSTSHLIYQVLFNDAHRSHLVVVSGAGVEAFRHDAPGLIDELRQRGVLQASDVVHLQWSLLFSRHLVALCFDTPAVAQQILAVRHDGASREGRSPLHVVEFRSFAGQCQQHARGQLSHATASSDWQLPTFAAVDVPVVSREDFCGRLLVDRGVGVQFVVDAPRLCRDAAQLIQRLVWTDVPPPEDGDDDSPQAAEAHLRRALDGLRGLMRQQLHHVSWISRSRLPHRLVFIQLAPEGQMLSWLAHLNPAGARDRMASLTQLEFTRLASRFPALHAFCTKKFAFLPKYGVITGCERIGCQRSHDMREYIGLFNRALIEDGEEPIAMPTASAEEGQRERRRSRSPPSRRRRSRSRSRSPPTLRMRARSRSRSQSPPQRRPTAAAARTRSRSRSRSPTRPSSAHAVGDHSSFALESFDRIAGGLLLQPGRVDVSTARFDPTDPTLQAATTDADAIMQRLVWTDPLGAPTDAEFATEDDREFDLRQVADQITAQGQIRPEEIAWVARILTPVGAPSSTVIIQLRPDEPMRTMLSRLHRNTDDCLFMTYLTWFFRATVTRHTELARACSLYFERMRTETTRLVENSCRQGDRCRQSHDPKLMTAIIERARADAVADAATEASSVPASHSHADDLYAQTKFDAADLFRFAPPSSIGDANSTATDIISSLPQSALLPPPRDPLGTVLFDTHTLTPTSIVTAAVALPILTADAGVDAAAHLLSVPMGAHLLAADRSELASTGTLPPHRRWEDARHCIRVLAQCGLVTTEDGLRAATRGGAESEFRLTLRFDSRDAVSRVHDRFTRLKQLQQTKCR